MAMMLPGRPANGINTALTSVGFNLFKCTVRVIAELDSGNNFQGRLISGGIAELIWLIGTALTASSPDKTIATPFCQHHGIMKEVKAIFTVNTSY